MERSKHHPFIEQATTADRHISVVVAISMVTIAIAASDLIEQIGAGEYYDHLLFAYLRWVSLAFIAVEVYGVYQLRLKQRTGWIIIAGLAAYGLAAPLIFWVPFLLEHTGVGTYGFGDLEVMDVLLHTVIAYFVANATQLYLLLRENVRERLQISRSLMTNTLLVSMAILVAHQLVVYLLSEMS